MLIRRIASASIFALVAATLAAVPPEKRQEPPVPSATPAAKYTPATSPWSVARIPGISPFTRPAAKRTVAPAPAPQLLPGDPAPLTAQASMFFNNNTAEVGIAEFEVTPQFSGTRVIDPSIVFDAGTLCGPHTLFGLVNTTTSGGFNYHIDFYTYNLLTYELTKVGEIGYIDQCPMTQDMAYDEFTGNIYATVEGTMLTRIVFPGDPASIEPEKDFPHFERVADLPEPITGLVTDGKGNMWGMADRGTLYHINMSTWRFTPIKQTGILNAFTSSATYEPNTGKIYYHAVQYDSNELYIIDPWTGNAQRVYDAGTTQFAALHFPPTYKNSAPGRATDLSLAYTNGSLTGTFAFTAPTQTYRERPLSGAMKAIVMVNDDIVATREGIQPGEKVTMENITVTEPGMKAFSVVFELGGNPGPRTAVKQYVGHDEPYPVDNLQLVQQGSSYVLTWDAVPHVGIEGGYIDPADLRYHVTRLPDGHDCGEVSAPRYSEPVPATDMFTPWQYRVEAVTTTQTSESRWSSVLPQGDLEPPYKAVFDSVWPSPYAIPEPLDLNGDGVTWQFKDYALVCHYNEDRVTPGDDYLFMRKTHFKAGRTYRLRVEAASFLFTWLDTFALYLVPSNDAEGVAPANRITVIEPTTAPYLTFETEYEARLFEMYEGEFTPTTDVELYPAIHYCSPEDKYEIKIGPFEITRGVNLNAPEAPQVTAVAGDNADMTVTFTITNPTREFDGDPLASPLTHYDIYLDGEHVGRQIPVDPSGTTVWTYRSTLHGNNNYQITASNAAGEGDPTDLTIWVGNALPLEPEWVKVQPGADNGTLVVTWAEVTHDEGGAPLRGATYRVHRFVGMEETVFDVEGTRLEDKVVEADADPIFVQYAVETVLDDFVSQYWATDGEGYPVGRPITMPWYEHFDAGGSQWFAQYYGTAMSFDIGMIGSNLGADGDQTYVTYSCPSIGDRGALQSNNIYVDPEAANPVATFYWMANSSSFMNNYFGLSAKIVHNLAATH